MLKSRKAQNLLIAILSVSIGISSYLYLASMKSAAIAGDQEVSAYVATADIPAGTTFDAMLRNSWITSKIVPADIASGNTVQSSGEFTQQEVSRAEISSGQLILRAMFAPAKNFASGLNIPKNFLAISISVDDVARVANFVVPGSRVVIFSTALDNKRGDAVTRVLVTNALVLAIGNQVDTPANGLQVATSPLVTLAVSSYEAEKIIHASQNTKLSFALAHANEPSAIPMPQSGISTAALFGQG